MRKIGKGKLGGYFCRISRPDDEKKHPLFIWCHGFGSDYLSGDVYEEVLAEAGYLFVSFDFRGGHPGDRSGGKTERMSVCTEWNDLRCLSEVLKRLPWAEEGKLFLGGSSQGGLVAALAAEELQANALFLNCPAFSLVTECQKDEAGFRQKLQDLPQMKLGEIYFRDLRTITEEEMYSYKGPLLIQHGEEDAIVPFASSLKAKENFFQAELISFPQGGHRFVGEDRRKAAENMVRFLKDHGE